MSYSMSISFVLYHLYHNICLKTIQKLPFDLHLQLILNYSLKRKVFNYLKITLH